MERRELTDYETTIAKLEAHYRRALNVAIERLDQGDREGCIDTLKREFRLKDRMADDHEDEYEIGFQHGYFTALNDNLIEHDVIDTMEKIYDHVDGLCAPEKEDTGPLATESFMTSIVVDRPDGDYNVAYDHTTDAFYLTPTKTEKPVMPRR